MSVTVPNAISLASIPDGSAIVASDHRNNYSAVQVGVNGLIAMFTAAPTKGDLLLPGGAGTWDRLAVGADGKVPVADAAQTLGLKYAYPPGFEFDYAEFSSNVNTTATSAGTATAVVTGNPVTFDGATVVIVEFYCSDANTVTTAGAAVVAELYDGATDLGIFAQVVTPAAATAGASLLARRKLTPSAGSHTFSIKGWTTSAGTATFLAGAGRIPGYIRITKA